MDRGRFRIFTVLILALLVLTSYAIFPRWTPPKAHAASLGVSLVANTSGWNYSQPSGLNPTISVYTGDDLTFQLTASDGYTHRFYVDVNNNTTPECLIIDDCSLNFTMSVSAQYSFTVNFGPGTYTYYDMYYQGTGHGKFVVSQSGPSFALSSSPQSLSVPRGSSAASTIYVTSQNGFTGTITLTANSPSGLTATINPMKVVVPQNGVSSSTLNVTVTTSSPSGTYNVIVTASNSTVSQSATVIVFVESPDFTISLSASSLNLAPGGSGIATVNLTSLYGFTGSINITESISPAGPMGSVQPTSVSIGSGSSSSATLTVSTSTSASPGNYIVRITGSANGPGGPLIHSTQMTLTIAATANGLVTSLLSSQFLVIGGIILLVIIISLVIYSKKRKTIPS